MRKLAIYLAGAISSLHAQTISEFALDPYKVVDLPVSREVTAVTFPAAITGVAAADVLMDDGRSGSTEASESPAPRFHVTHVKGANFLLLQSLQAEGTATLTILFEGGAYILNLRTVATNPVASAIFQRPTVPAPKPVDRAPEPVKFSPRIGLSILDRARAYPVLVRTLPKAVEGVSVFAQNRKTELPDLVIDVQEVYRFSREDAVVFLLNLQNKTDQELEILPSSFAARVGEERFEQSIANGPRRLAPGERREAEFAIVGMPDGTRNDLSADNAFTILVSTSRRESEGAAASPPVATAGALPKEAQDHPHS